MKNITEETTQAELEIELAKLGVGINQISFMPDGRRRCDLATHRWARGHGEGATIAEAMQAALLNLREQIAILSNESSVSASPDKVNE